MKMLFVDDDRTILKFYESVTKKNLPKDSYVLAESGEEAVDILNNKTFDLVITDMMMPGITGLDLLKRIKKAEPSIEVIVITAQASVEDAAEVIREGAREYLQKPINKDFLLKKIENIREYKRSLREVEEQAVAKETNELELNRTVFSLEKKILHYQQIIDRAIEVLGSKNQALETQQINEARMILHSSKNKKDPL